MTGHRYRNILPTLLFLLGVAACGDGSQVAGGGIGGTGISQGSITQFGSVWVNGVEFTTTNAAITRDGTPVAQSDLQLGMVVTVNGAINSDGVSGTALSVSYSKELEGPVSAIPNANTLTVLGQTVIVDNLTKFKVNGITSPTINDIHVKDTVEVSGFPTATGFRAAYIEVKSAGSEVELKGTISAVGNGTISIGTQSVDITLIQPSFSPQVGDYVEVKGTLQGMGVTLLANTIEQKSRALGSANKSNAELQGFITAVTSTNDFVVDAQRVQTISQTTFKGGTAADIKTGVRLEVEGALVNGVLLATKVSFEDDLSLEGNVTSIIGNTIKIDTNSGINVEINDVLTEGAATPINVNDHVKVRGRKLDTTNLLATEVEVSSAGVGTTPVKLQGLIDAISAGTQSITVLGVSLDLSTVTTFSGESVTDRTSFFNTVKVGDLVEVKGVNTGGTITWQTIELEH